MKNDAEKGKTRSRSRKKAAATAASASPAPTPAPEESPASASFQRSPPPAPTLVRKENPVPASFKNVGALESGFSLLLGAFFVLAALFPRSIKQLFLLGAGTGLVYRGMTSHCGVYQALGLDTDKGSLVGQVTEKVLAAKQG